MRYDSRQPVLPQRKSLPKLEGYNIPKENNETFLDSTVQDFNLLLAPNSK